MKVSFAIWFILNRFIFEGYPIAYIILDKTTWFIFFKSVVINEETL